MDAQIDTAWRELVEAELNRRLAERERTLDGQQAEVSEPQIRVGRDAETLLLTSDM